MEISSRTLIPLFTPGSVHSGSASWDDCAWVFPDEICMHVLPKHIWMQILAKRTKGYGKVSQTPFPNPPPPRKKNCFGTSWFGEIHVRASLCHRWWRLLRQNTKSSKNVFVIKRYKIVAQFPRLVFVTPQWGAADAEIKVPPGENTELKRFPFKAWSKSVYSHTCYAYCQGSFLLISTLPVHSSAFFPKPLPIFPCVGCG